VHHQRHTAVASAQEVRLTHLMGAAAPGRYRSTGSCAVRLALGCPEASSRAGAHRHRGEGEDSSPWLPGS
jgi:hypothetical protein